MEIKTLLIPYSREPGLKMKEFGIISKNTYVYVSHYIINDSNLNLKDLNEFRLN